MMEQVLNLAPELKALFAAAIAYGILLLLRALVCRFKKVEADDAQFYRVILSVFALRTTHWFYVSFALYTGVWIFFREKGWFVPVHRMFFVLFMVQLWIWTHYFVSLVFERRTRKLAPQDISKATSFRAISFVLNLVLLVFLVLFTLDNFGVNITALVTGLGVGGIAIALAVQNILSDLFASITIILDKPFVVGDFIVVGEISGTIENIGIKTTRVRSLSGEQVVFSNADLLQSRIRNFKRLYERRIAFTFGLTYETPLDVVKQIPEVVKEIVSALPTVRFDRAHFQKFGESSLDFEVVYFVLDPSYNVYMDRQQALNLELARRVAELKAEFAFPTRTLYAPRIEAALTERASSAAIKNP